MLKASIDALNLAENNSNIAPVKAVFSPVSTLLATMRVCLLFFCNDSPQVHTQLGLDGQRTGSHQARVVLRRCLSSARPADERKDTGRDQSVRVRYNGATEIVSGTSGAHFEPSIKHPRSQDRGRHSEEARQVG